MSQTRLESWIALQQSLSARQQQALSALQKIGPATNLELSNWLQWPLNCVTGRITELRKQGIVREFDRILHEPTARSHSRWVSIGNQGRQISSGNIGSHRR